MRVNIAVLVFLLCGLVLTSQSQVTKPGPLKVGAAKVDITPAANELPSQYLGVLDKVYSRAIVIDNGVATAALVTVDVLAVSDPLWKRVSGRIASELGIPVKNIVIGGTSTHSVPLGSAGPMRPDPPGPLDDKIFSSVNSQKKGSSLHG